MRRGFKSWSERESQRVRAELGLRSDAPLPARRLADHLGVSIVTPEAVPDLHQDVLRSLSRSKSWSAVTIPFDAHKVIVHNPVHSAARQESDLMHEMGHLLCKHEPAKILRNHTCARTCNGTVEEEATWLGASLQLPRIGLLASANAGRSNEEIANYFGASLQMVKFRRRITGVDRQGVQRRS